MLTLDVTCSNEGCNERGEAVILIQKDHDGTEVVAVGMPRGGWGFYCPDQQTIKPLCPKCKGTKGAVGYPVHVPQ